MKTILCSRRHRHATRVTISLILIALIGGMVACGGGGGGVTRYTLTMTVAGGNGTAIDLTNASPYPAGTVVNIKATAAPDYGFRNWTAPAGTFGNATAATTTFTMPAQNVTVTANFAIGLWDWYDLNAVRDDLNGSYLLMNDLDSTIVGYYELGSQYANFGRGWLPIGGWDTPFAGTFDGQGYEIRDLFIDCLGDMGVGLFGAVAEGGVLRNIGLVNTDVSGGSIVGALAGAHFGGTVSNCYATGNVTGTLDYSIVGGLLAVSGGTISNSYSDVAVTGSNGVGGLVAVICGPGLAKYGIPTSFGSGSVNNSYSTGNVTGIGALNFTLVGGLVGLNGGPLNNSYSTCSVTGSLTGNSSVGGLVGENCDGTLGNSYSTGNVTGSFNVGGLVGHNDGGIVNNSFWDTQTSGQSTSAGGTGKTTAQMRDIATFSGATWNITAVAVPGIRNPSYIWNIIDDVTYPFLSWQPQQ